MDMTEYSWISSPPGYPMARKYRVVTGVPEYGLDRISIQSHPCCAPVKQHLYILRTSSQISFQVNHMSSLNRMSDLSRTK